MSNLLRSYIAAGFDPARFWDLTPRLYAVEMAGAGDRAKRERALVWWGGMISRAAEPPDFEAFTGCRPDKATAIKRWAAAWDKVDAGLGRRKKRD